MEEGSRGGREWGGGGRKQRNLIIVEEGILFPVLVRIAEVNRVAVGQLDALEGSEADNARLRGQR